MGFRPIKIQHFTRSNNPRKSQRAILFSAMMVWLLTQPAYAATVCDSGCDETSIGAVITDSQYDGQDIIVFPGTYMESNLNIVARNLISNSDNPADTIIDGGGTAISGAVLNVSGIGKTIRGFTITGGNNIGDNGGGINVSGSITLQNLIIEGNRTDFAGGGVGTNSIATIAIVDSLIETNTADQRGGGVFVMGDLSMTNTDVLGNTVSGSNVAGGGVAVQATLGNTLSISGGEISGNTLISSTAVASGGGIFAGDQATITDVSISGNTATGAGGSSGGGIYGGTGNLTINGGSIQGNTASLGGGLYVASSGLNVTIVNGTEITTNTATNTGGGIYCGINSLQQPFAGNLSNNTPNEIDGTGCTSIADLGVGDDSQANDEESGTDGDPVNTFTGELFNYYPADLNLGGPLPLLFARYYAYRLELAGVRSTLGTNWRHNYAWAINRIGTDAEIVTGDGRRLTFTDNGSTWDQSNKTDHLYQFEETVGGFTLTDMKSELQRDFDNSGRYVTLRDGPGNTHTLTYGPDGQLATISDGLGRTLTLTHDANSHLTSLTDGTRMVTYRYVDNNLVGVTNPMGNETVHFYNPNASAIAGLLWSTTEPEGNVPFSQTSFDKQVVTQTNADGHVYSFDYSVPNNTTITDPDGNTRVHTHTATGEFTNRQDQTGQSFSMGYDADGRRNSITDRLGDTTSLTYHTASGKVASVTNADGTSMSYAYTARAVGGINEYDLTGITHADTTTESFVYDASGNLSSSTDQAGFVLSGTYNANGQVLTATNVAGGIATHTYNADGTRDTTTDPAGNTTNYSYDALHRLTGITLADTNTLGFTYDDNNNPLTTTDENGNVVTLVYDTNNRLTDITDSLSNTTSFSYDGNNRLLSTTDSLLGTTSQTYDSLGRLSTLTNRNSNTTTLGYNILGRLTSTTNPLGNVSTYTYDAEKIIASITDPLSNTTTFTSDQMGRITQTTSPLGNIVGIAYDSMGRISAATDPLGQVTTLNRDVRGLLSGIDLPEGISTSYVRNAFGRITDLTDAGGNVWARTYDNNGYQLSSTDPLGNQRSMTYDNRNRLSTVTYPNALGSQALTYDPAGNLTDSDYSDGTVFNFIYDANDRLTSAEGISRSYDARGLISDTNGIAIGRDAGGRIISMTLAAGKAVTYAYDANDNLTSVTDWDSGITTFSYDIADRLISITRPNGLITTRTYDNDSRLTGLSEGILADLSSVSSIALTRDANGQITAATRSVPLANTAATLGGSNNTYDAASQINGATYDVMGRLLNDGTRAYAWDLASRLTSMTQNSNTVSFTYSASGNRLTRTEGGVTRDYVWNAALGLKSISVEKEAAADLRYYIHTPGGRLLYSMDANDDARSFYHFNELGNTLFVSNDAGAVIGSYAYSPYGEVMASTGGLDNPFTWQGQYGVVDEGDGIYHVRARYYDANSGRFISRDPSKSISPKAVNPYQYALNNPLQFVDPSGREPLRPVEFDLAKAEADLASATAAEQATDRAVDAAILADNRAIDDFDSAEESGERAAKRVADRTLQAVNDAIDAIDPAHRATGNARDRFNELRRQAEDRSKVDRIKRDKAGLIFFPQRVELAAEETELAAESEREAHILHLRDNINDARQEVRDAQKYLRTDEANDGFIEDAEAADLELKKAQDALEDEGEIDSVIPELSGVVVL